MSHVRKTKEERAASILEAMCMVLLEKGFKSATTRLVTSKAEVSPGLLNRYYTWNELRALAFERLMILDTSLMFSENQEGNADEKMTTFLEAAFVKRADPLLRIWSEARDEAPDDPILARSMKRVFDKLKNTLGELLTQGNRENAWHCTDVNASAVRILAIHEGLYRYLKTPTTSITRADAGMHLRVMVARECGNVGKLK